MTRLACLTVAEGIELMALIRAAEEIVSDDFCFELDLRNAAGELSGDLKTAHGKLMLLYRIIHGSDPRHSCSHVHEKWRNEAHAVIQGQTP